MMLGARPSAAWSGGLWGNREECEADMTLDELREYADIGTAGHRDLEDVERWARRLTPTCAGAMTTCAWRCLHRGRPPPSRVDAGHLARCLVPIR